MRPSKKEDIITQSLALFYRYGFHATGVDFIVKKTGISKTTIYAHFDSKDVLISAVLARRDNDFRQWLEQRVEALATSPIDKLFCVFDALDEWFEQPEFSSCLFVKAASEYQDPNHLIYQQAKQHKSALVGYFVQLSNNAGLSNAETWANQLVLLKEGAIIAAHLKLMPKPGAHAKEMLKQLLQTSILNS